MAITATTPLMDLTALINDIMLAHPTAEVTVVRISPAEVQPSSAEADGVAPRQSPEERPIPAGGGTDEGLVQEAIDAGIANKKVTEWARALSVSEAELRRAIKQKVLRSRPKEDGRDSGALMVTSSDLATYLQVRSAVCTGTMEEPEWWADVVKSC